jgi:hypothetical protein
VKDGVTMRKSTCLFRCKNDVLRRKKRGENRVLTRRFYTETSAYIFLIFGNSPNRFKRVKISLGRFGEESMHGFKISVQKRGLRERNQREAISLRADVNGWETGLFAPIKRSA